MDVADLTKIGKHCSEKDCHQLDFLPFECIRCKNVFCKLHFQPDDHQCDKNSSKNLTDSELESLPGTAKFSCSYKGCGVKGHLELLCSDCSQHFCLEHRFHNQHYDEPPTETELLPMTKQVVNDILKKNEPSKPLRVSGRNVKSQKLAAKVQLMKMKMKSIGNSGLPTQKRFYLKVIAPLQYHKKITQTFVSTTWSVGKVIDELSELCKVQNNNNRGTEKKIRLFRFIDGHSLSHSLDKPLEYLIQQDEIYNGDTVVLEYVNETITQIDNKLYS